MLKNKKNIGDNGLSQAIVTTKKDNRLKYYEALDKAHTTGDYTDFVKLVTEAENEMLDRYLSVVE